MAVKRDRVFWTIALQLSVVNFFLGGFGPSQPLLRTQQHTSLAIAGLHGTSMGIAAILAGFASPRLVHFFGREKTSWMGLGLCSFGVVLFIFSPPVQMTLFATLIAGFGVSTVINSSVTRLSARYPENSSQAVSHAIGFGSFGYIFGTLAVGTFAGTSFSWRSGLLIVAPFSIILYFINRKTSPANHVVTSGGPQRGKLSKKFWVAWIGFVACISGEFATTFWSAALLRDRNGSTASISTICIVAFGLGMALGRVFGPKFLSAMELDRQLKSMITLQLVGFMTLWQSHTLLLSLFALFATGLGLSMQFAALSIRLIGFSDGRSDLAIGQSSFGAGVAIAGSPFLLGLFGDHLGISRAYLMVPVLIAITLVTIFLNPSERVTVQEKS